nr:hypothetical protein CFP56_60480 [Quercus suber]
MKLSVGADTLSVLKRCGWPIVVAVLRAWQVEHHGTPMFKVTKKLKKYKKMLKSWSREHFGSVKIQIAKKKELPWKAEEAAAKGGDYESIANLQRELNILLDKESRMWR